MGLSVPPNPPKKKKKLGEGECAYPGVGLSVPVIFRGEFFHPSGTICAQDIYMDDICMGDTLHPSSMGPSVPKIFIWMIFVWVIFYTQVT